MNPTLFPMLCLRGLCLAFQTEGDDNNKNTGAPWSLHSTNISRMATMCHGQCCAEVTR